MKRECFTPADLKKVAEAAGCKYEGSFILPDGGKITDWLWGDVLQFINKIHRSGCCIYCIENITKAKKYIGQSTNITYRRESHRYALIKGTHPNKEMQADYNSGDTFEIKAIEYFPPWVAKQFLNGKEAIYIKKYKSNVRGYNIATPPKERSKCNSHVDKYKLSSTKLNYVVSHINQNGGLVYLRIYDLCSLLNCQPGDLMEYIPDETKADNKPE